MQLGVNSEPQKKAVRVSGTEAMFERHGSRFAARHSTIVVGGILPRGVAVRLLSIQS
jgi:hypothetical protein